MTLACSAAPLTVVTPLGASRRDRPQPGGYDRRVIGTVATATVSVLAAAVTLAPATVIAGNTPPPTPPDSGIAAPERRLAEFSFAMFVTLELEVDPGEFTCSAPGIEGEDNDIDIMCFALIDGTRVIIATTTSSDGTGVYEWVVVSDHPLNAGTPTTSTTAPPTSVPIANANLSDAAILSYGEELNRAAAGFKDDVLGLTEGTITEVITYGWDGATATVTLDVTLDPAQDFDPDLVAWILVQVLKFHWARGEPFRLDGATLRPRLVLVVSATQYMSDFDLTVRVADQLIANTDWVAAARQD